MNREELSIIFTEVLKTKLINTEYGYRKICDVEVDISEEYWEDENCGGSFDKIEIRVKTLSPKGKNSRSEHYYL